MLTLLTASSFAQDGAAAPPESRWTEVRATVEPKDTPAPSLTYLGLVRNKAVMTDVISTNPFLDGQVVGRLGGTNGLSTGEETSVYMEQRLGSFFSYSPPILDGKATLAAAFEIDFGWGDRSYGVAGNLGGGFGADMVNLQTQRLMAIVRPLKGAHDLSIHAGLQFVPDGPFDPTASRPDDLFRTSGRLLLFGSEASGLAAYGRVGGRGGTWLRYRLGSFTLWEQGLGTPDDVTLHVADARFEPTWNTGAGLHAFWLRDRSGSHVGALGVGPTSALSEMQGGPRIPLLAEGETGEAPDADTDVLWLVADGSYNHRLDRGPVGLTGMVAADIGQLYIVGRKDRAIRGLMLDAEARARWARGDGSVARAEVLWTSHDDPATPEYTGAITANSWGFVGALAPTHGCVLLLPDPFAVNRYTGVVHDVSNGGAGVLATTGSFGFDPIPSRLTTTIGAGWASAQGKTVGTELNAHVVAEALLFMNVGLHAGVVLGTDLPKDPWMAYASFDWVVFQ